MELNNRLIQDAVDQFASLPGIGKKTALRLTLHLLKQNEADVHAFGDAFQRMRAEVQFCTTCHNISDSPQCSVCSSHKREASILCVVEDMRDVIAIENTHQYTGRYHVLGGIISPMDGIGPSDLNIETLVQRVQHEEINEVIMALPTTMEGDTTNFYIYKRLKDVEVVLTTIARGVAVGDELEYTDEVTLGRSIINRTQYETSLAR